MDGLRFRFARRDDQVAIMRLFREARAWHRTMNVEQWPEFDPEAILADIEKNTVLVSLLGESLVGTATIYEEDPLIWTDDEPAFYIHRMASARSIKGRGLGKQIVDCLSLHAAASGKSFLRLDCWASNESLKRHYEQLGFLKLRDLFMGEARSLPAHYWNSTTTLFQKPIRKV